MDQCFYHSSPETRVFILVALARVSASHWRSVFVNGVLGQGSPSVMLTLQIHVATNTGHNNTRKHLLNSQLFPVFVFKTVLSALEITAVHL